MKNFTLLLKLSLIAAFFVSCSGDELTNADLYQEEVPQKIADYVGSDSNYTIFNDAILGSEIQDWLAHQENITLFAPTNVAFENYLSQNGMTSVNQIPQDELAQLLKNHVIQSEILISDLNTVEELFVETMAQTSFESSSHVMSIISNHDGLKINGVPVITPDMLFVNGVVHSVDHIVELSTARTFINECLEFSSFKSLIEASADASTAFTTLETKFQSGLSQELTVFVPDNAAVDTFLAGLNAGDTNNNIAQSINFAISTQLSFQENYEVSELSDGLIISTLGSDVSTSMNSQSDITFSTGPFSEVVKFRSQDFTSIQTSNGILLLTDKVLF
ncbi:fasciclin domain-containing protein [Nonlabens ulvanivorans]|uniref:fasciclin domain-containing protein n=1 Tax=Nonlabens ulvanivorans TaxID=906888 RepID=UPI0029427E05|nr:fasciclin domain-containing protein [Nonlabens ulvanivorans]WOI22422.1 fasciclin domain-containing protein [Nonlabens ulvanivorans]